MKKLDIVYEDKELLVVNKPSKLLTISDGKTENTLYSMARSYVKKQHKNNKIFIVHRLDRDTSGIVLFAKSEAIKKELQTNWNEITKRKYIAIVDGILPTKKGVIKEYLLEDKTHRVYRSYNKKGEYAETKYEVKGYKKNTTCVEIEIKTGKKNQIRVGFANLGYPVVDDKKYGNKTNKIGRLALHAYELELVFHKKQYKWNAKIPKEFLRYIEGDKNAKPNREHS